jgi:hypothetical protein
MLTPPLRDASTRRRRLAISRPIVSSCLDHFLDRVLFLGARFLGSAVSCERVFWERVSADRRIAMPHIASLTNDRNLASDAKARHERPIEHGANWRMWRLRKASWREPMQRPSRFAPVRCSLSSARYPSLFVEPGITSGRLPGRE